MIPAIEDCNPGLKPVGYTVLVALDVTEEKTAGGIILPDKHKEREDSASERGRIIWRSDMAFKGGDWANAKIPAQGQIVLFQRYAGTEVEGADGRKYRIILDEDIRGVFE